MSREEIVRVVDAQLAAYNARDIDKFVDCYIENVPVYTFPSGEEIKESTGQNFRDRYRRLFENSPNLDCKLVSRCVKDNIVIDQELVTGFNQQDEAREAMAIYEVIDHKIHRVWFAK